MHPIGSWLVSWAIEEAPELEFDFVNLPAMPEGSAGDQGSVIAVETGYMVNANSPNIDLAVEFLALLNSPENVQVRRTRRRSSRWRRRSRTSRWTHVAAASVELLHERRPSSCRRTPARTSRSATSSMRPRRRSLAARRRRPRRWPTLDRPWAASHRPGRSLTARSRPAHHASTYRHVKADPAILHGCSWPRAGRIRPRRAAAHGAHRGLQLHGVGRLRADDVRGPRQLRPRARRRAVPRLVRACPDLHRRDAGPGGGRRAGPGRAGIDCAAAAPGSGWPSSRRCMLPMVVVAVLWSFVYNPDFGLINGVLEALGLEQLGASGWATRRPRCWPSASCPAGYTRAST